MSRQHPNIILFQLIEYNLSIGYCPTGGHLSFTIYDLCTTELSVSCNKDTHYYYVIIVMLAIIFSQ